MTAVMTKVIRNTIMAPMMREKTRWKRVFGSLDMFVQVF